jgi:hypothetical protein
MERQRMSGTLAATNTAQSTFVANVTANGAHTTLTVSITPTIRLRVSSIVYTGAADPEALAVERRAAPTGYLAAGSQVMQAHGGRQGVRLARYGLHGTFPRGCSRCNRHKLIRTARLKPGGHPPLVKYRASSSTSFRRRRRSCAGS